MTTSEYVASTILKATGEVSTAANGDAEWNKVLGIGNFYLNTWASEPGVDWDSLYTPEYSLGTVSATSTYDLDDEIIKISDQAGDIVRIDHTDGVGYSVYQIVNANQLKRYYEGNKATSHGNVCAQVGRTLVFNKVFAATDPEFGGAITVPIYVAPEPLVNESDTVPVDDPNWLVVIAAAEYVRNDITLQQQYPNLITEANQLMQDMKNKNDTAQLQEIVRGPAGDGAGW